jgi:hypothetical protein
MVKKTPQQFVIALFVAFSLFFVQSQSCYASSGRPVSGVYTFDGNQWQYTNGPAMNTQGGTNAITSSASKFWASSGYSDGEGYTGGVFSNTNPPSASVGWTQLSSDGLTNQNVLSLQFNFDDNFLYAGCDASTSTDSTAFKISNTTDGASWEDITGDGLTGNPVNAYCLYNGNKIYAGTSVGTSNGGVYAYSGSGTTWTSIGSDITGINVYALQAMGSNIYAGTDNYGVLRATIAK